MKHYTKDFSLFLTGNNNRLYPALLILSAIAVYFPILGNDFLYSWDDHWMVMNEYTEGGINFRNIKLILTSISHGQYMPVNFLEFLFLYSLVGYNAFYFHLFFYKSP